MSLQRDARARAAHQSAIVRLRPMTPQAMLQRGVVSDEAALARIVTAAFSQRRKTLRNALAAVISAEGLGRLGIDAGLRPENLSVTDYVAIANTAATEALPPHH